MFDDFKPYSPSNGAPASFVATSIFDQSGEKVGVLAFQMPISRINGIMGGVEGMGETGESYIVGSDFLMRSHSRFSTTSTILERKIDGPTVRAALDGQTGLQTIKDYRGVPVASAYRPFEFMDTRWAIIAEVDVEEFTAPITSMQFWLITITLALIVVVGVAGVLFARSITLPISNISAAATRLAEGDETCTIPHTTRGDELGGMAAAVQVFKEGLRERRRLHEEAQQADAERQEREKEERLAKEQRDREALQLEQKAAKAREDRSKRIEEIVVGFDTQINSIIAMVSSAATELESTASSMADLASNTDTLAPRQPPIRQHPTYKPLQRPVKKCLLQ